MMLAIRTDSAQAELYLFDQGKAIDKYVWQAGRNLASELLPSIDTLVTRNNMSSADLTGIIIFTGQGSFTGLRIGTTVANTLAYAYAIPVVSAEGTAWLDSGVKKIENAVAGQYVVPKYSSPPNITQPRA